MNHTSGDSFKKHLRIVNETLTHHYTLAPATDNWANFPAKRHPGTSTHSEMQQSSKSETQEGSQAVLGGAADSFETILQSNHSSRRTPRKPIRQQKLPYFPYNNDRLKVLNLNEVPPMNWPGAQAAYLSTQIRGRRSA